jgi:hypothetical protein
MAISRYALSGSTLKKIDMFLPNRPSRGVLLSLPRPKGALRRKRSANGKFQLGLADNPLKTQNRGRKGDLDFVPHNWNSFRPALNSFHLAWKPFLSAERVGRSLAGGARSAKRSAAERRCCAQAALARASVLLFGPAPSKPSDWGRSNDDGVLPDLAHPRRL